MQRWTPVVMMILLLTSQTFPRTAEAQQGGAWYLMIPPVVKEGSPSIDVSKFTAPLREWQNLGAYDTAAACEKQRFETWMMLSGVAAETKETGVQTLATFMARVYRSSLCIASNDPRLR